MADLEAVIMQKGEDGGIPAASYPSANGKIQAVTAINPDTLQPIDFAKETTLTTIKTVVDNLLTAANAIKVATQALNTSNIQGTVALDAPSLAALETITANTGGLTDTQLRASSLNVTVSNPTSNITGYATEATLAQVKTALETISGNTDTVEALQTAANATLTNLAAYNDSVETLLTTLGGNTDGLEALLNTLGVQTDQVEPLLQSISDKLPALASGKTPVADSALFGVQDSINTLTETMLYLLGAIFEKMPRLQANDRAMVDLSETSLATITTLTTANDLLRLQAFGGSTLNVTKSADAIPLHLSNVGALHLYDKIIVS